MNPHLFFCSKDCMELIKSYVVGKLLRFNSQKLPKWCYFISKYSVHYFHCLAPISWNGVLQFSAWVGKHFFSVLLLLHCTGTWAYVQLDACFYSRTSKAFSNKQTVKQCGCSEVYLDCLQTFLPALSCPLQKEVLRSGVRTFLHRMIICLEEEVLPFIPSASEHMLKDCEAKDLQEFIPLINQITAKFKVWYCISFSGAKCCWEIFFSSSRKTELC